MKLALVTHKVVIGDGQGRINYEIAHEALRRGHRVTFVASVVEPELASHNAATWIRIQARRALIPRLGHGVRRTRC